MANHTSGARFGGSECCPFFHGETYGDFCNINFVDCINGMTQYI